MTAGTWGLEFRGAEHGAGFRAAAVAAKIIVTSSCESLRMLNILIIHSGAQDVSRLVSWNRVLLLSILEPCKDPFARILESFSSFYSTAWYNRMRSASPQSTSGTPVLLYIIGVILGLYRDNGKENGGYREYRVI